MEEVFSVLHVVLRPLLITGERLTAFGGTGPTPGITSELSTIAYFEEAVSGSLFKPGITGLTYRLIHRISTRELHRAPSTND
jgi:hypothetical protein